MNLQIVSIEKLRTSLAYLRSQVPPRHFHLEQLPIRVVRCPDDDGYFEVVDGFKRLRGAVENGEKEIGVVIEDATGPQVKALMLHANALERTLSPMDESRVLVSMVEDDDLTIAQAARMLRRKRPWASKRYSLAKRLSLSLHKEVDAGRLPVSVAYALTALNDKQEQEKIAHTIFSAGLSATNALAMVSTYRVLEEASQKQALLHDPLGTLDELSQSSRKSSPVLSSIACRIKERYRCLHEGLDRFLKERSPEAVSVGEARLLEAERKMLVAKIISCADKLRYCQDYVFETTGATI